MRIDNFEPNDKIPEFLQELRRIGALILALVSVLAFFFKILFF